MCSKIVRTQMQHTQNSGRFKKKKKSELLIINQKVGKKSKYEEETQKPKVSTNQEKQSNKLGKTQGIKAKHN